MLSILPTSQLLTDIIYFSLVTLQNESTGLIHRNVNIMQEKKTFPCISRSLFVFYHVRPMVMTRGASEWRDESEWSPSNLHHHIT